MTFVRNSKGSSNSSNGSINSSKGSSNNSSKGGAPGISFNG